MLLSKKYMLTPKRLVGLNFALVLHRELMGAFTGFPPALHDFDGKKIEKMLRSEKYCRFSVFTTLYFLTIVFNKQF